MRTSIGAALAAIILCGTAGAATVTAFCSPFPAMFTSGAGSTNISCPSFNTANGGPPAGGTVLTSASLYFLADYLFGAAGGTNVVTMTFTPAGSPAGVTWALSPQTISVSGMLSSSSSSPLMGNTYPGVPDLATAGITYANFASAFNIAVSSHVDLGAVVSSSAAISVRYDYDTFNPPVPEPSSLMLFASGLLGLGFFGRRLRRN